MNSNAKILQNVQINQRMHLILIIFYCNLLNLRSVSFRQR